MTLTDLTGVMEKCSVMLIDAAGGYCSRLWCILELALWVMLKAGERCILPAMVNGSRGHLFKACVRKDHEAWIDTELQRLDGLGRGAEMRALLQEAAESGLCLRDPSEVRGCLAVLPAVQLQRWYRRMTRRRCFLATVQRAGRRRRFLDERRQVAQRVRMSELAVKEMQTRMAQPRGARLANRWQGEQEADAATRVQSLWRKLKARAVRRQREAQQTREQAARKLQAFARRSIRQRRPSLLLTSAQENPWFRPVESERLLQHEAKVLQSHSRFQASQAHRLEEARRSATSSYSKMLQGYSQRSYDVWLALLQKEQVRTFIRAIEAGPCAGPGTVVGHRAAEDRGGRSLQALEQACQFRFRAVPKDRLTKKNLSGPFLHLTDDRGKTGDDAQVRSMEGKGQDYALSEEIVPGPGLIVGFFSHTRSGLRIEKKTQSLLDVIPSTRCSHLWIDACCLPQHRMAREHVFIGFADLAASIWKCDIFIVDLAEQYCQQLWCVVEWVLWAALKRGEKWSAPIVVNGAAHDLLSAFDKRDHKLWIQEELRRLDGLGKGNEMRAILQSARDFGIYLEDARKVREALVTRVDWHRPLPFGVCTAALLGEAEQSHRSWKAAIVRDRAVGRAPAAAESRTEEAEADSLLGALEVDLGYDFSLTQA